MTKNSIALISALIATNLGSAELAEFNNLLEKNNEEPVRIPNPLKTALKFDHDQKNIYKAIGFTPNETFDRLQNIYKSLPDKGGVNRVKASEAIEALLEDAECTAQCASLFTVLVNELPMPIIHMALIKS